jgi:hypothetical protein
MTLRHAVLTVLLLTLSGSQALSRVCDAKCVGSVIAGNYRCIRGCPQSNFVGAGIIADTKDSSLVTCVNEGWSGGSLPTHQGRVTRGSDGWVIKDCYPKSELLHGLYGHISQDRSDPYHWKLFIKWGPWDLGHSDPTKIHVWQQLAGGSPPFPPPYAPLQHLRRENSDHVTHQHHRHRFPTTA